MLVVFLFLSFACCIFCAVGSIAQGKGWQSIAWIAAMIFNGLALGGAL